jgi:hypothetical protein
MIAALIPFFVWVLAAWLLFLRGGSTSTVRESLLTSAVLITAWLVLGVEGLSLLHAIRFWPVLLWWLVPLCILAGVLFIDRSRLWRRWPVWPRLKLFDWALLCIIAVVLGWSLCQAFFSPPNNVDSQEYHLQRQVFWMQQGSVEHYPTSNLRQVAMPPLTEFAGLTLMVLTDGDRYHNLVQWGAFVLCLLVVSLVTRLYNESVRAQLLAAVWVATIPLAFLQASTTKNDVVVMLWACLLLYWTMLLPRPEGARWSQIALIGFTVGALVLTKGTGLVFGLPLGVLTGFFLLRYHTRAAVPALLLIGGLSLAFNAGHFARNDRTFATVAPDRPGIHDGPPVGNADFSAGALASNMLRNVGSHLVAPSDGWNAGLTRWMRGLHERLGRSIDDPNTTWLPGGRFRPYHFSQNDEDKAAAPAHLLIVLLLPVGFLLARKQIPWRPTLAILLVVLGGFVLFSLLLKWQNWHVRLVITLPALLAPVFAWTFAAPRLRYGVSLTVALLTVTLVPSMNSLQRPLLGPKNIFTTDPLALRCYYHPNWASDYRKLGEMLETRHPRVIGFYTPPGSPDYPIQRLLLDTASVRPVFTAFNARLQIPGKPEADPDALLVLRWNAPRIQHDATGTWYREEARIGRYTLFVKAPSS